MRRMDEDMNQLFESLGLAVGGTRTALPTPAEAGRAYGLPTSTFWSPRIEVQQRQGELLVRADLPGVKAEDIDVAINNGVLTITGERRQEHQEEREGFVRSELSYGSFHRAVPLPDGADESRIVATFRNGTLEIKVPVAEGERSRRIKVQS
jgi:HSP20 family protein